MRVHSRSESSRDNYKTYGLLIFWRDILYDEDEYLLPSEISSSKVEEWQQNELDVQKPTQPQFPELNSQQIDIFLKW